MKLHAGYQLCISFRPALRKHPVTATSRSIKNNGGAGRSV
jgi:hypothetical protein